MDLLQIREKEIFEVLKKIKKHQFVVIGGYAVNTYTLPRFSVDCDIVVLDKKELEKIEKTLLKEGYKKNIEEKENVLYGSNFKRYEKYLINNFKVSLDVLVKEIFDRQTNVIFSAKWVFKNSEIKALKGKTIAGELKLMIINLDALFVMKMISCRSTDIRDLFMLAPNIKDKNWIKSEISSIYDFKNRFTKIKEKITSKEFKDGLQGVYGAIDERVFERHKKSIIAIEK